MYFQVLCTVVGGLGIFLLGMENMSSGMQKIAGPRLKKILATLTTNRVLGIFTGILITALVQSSSVSTVMTIGFVNASLLSLKQALGIILGANIGTTITGWLLAMNIGKYGLPIVGVAAILLMFKKEDKIKIRLRTLMGFGFIFLGLQLMSDGLRPLRDLPEFVNMFQAFQANSYLGVLKVALVGAAITGIVQSSAATLGITITLASQGLIDYPTAVALVLGENVGTTITALLASLGASSNAKRAAYAHTLINLIGVLWVTAIFPYYLFALENILDPMHHMGAAIASAHTFFNICNVILLIPFIGMFDTFLQKVVSSDENMEEGEMKVTKLSAMGKMLPTVIIDQTKNEVLTMGKYIKHIFFRLEELYEDSEKIPVNVAEINEVEDKLDLYEKEINNVNYALLNRTLNQEYIEKTRRNLLVCDEYETISDYIGRIGDSIEKLQEHNILIEGFRVEILKDLNDKLVQFFQHIHHGYESKEMKYFSEGIDEYNEIKNFCKMKRKEHFKDNTENIIPSRLNTEFSDIINYYQRAADHIYNIIEFYMKL
ncbi:Na/Pi cotransporter family protein [Fusobacterium necrophorum]|uniref:Na/Pi cotransporter family protein n=1 Tax=Fusobacterium necrophorum TaxID=859 RepID=A0A4Q2KYX4_9FUSO|nr:Na/Pi cotransporter family protein [Fusobacterium necrophorum]RXZ69193.1 Na/Pi cotransporter family protein [Fusobacterium necrophorum]